MCLQNELFQMGQFFLMISACYQKQIMVFGKIKTHILIFKHCTCLHAVYQMIWLNFLKVPFLTNTHFPSFRSFKETFPFSFYGGVISYFEFKSIIMNGVVTGMSKITQKEK